MEEEILMTSLLVSCHKAEMFWRKCYPYSPNIFRLCSSEERTILHICWCH